MSVLDDGIDTNTRELLARYHFDEACFEQLRARLSRGHAEEADNRVQGELEPPHPDDVARLPALGTSERERLHADGLAALSRGQVAGVILAGGMATRFGGVVKAGVEVLAGQSFLQLKLRDLEQLARRAGTRLHVMLMTSFATDAAIQSMLLSDYDSGSALQVEAFAQFVSLRLSQTGELLRDHAGKVSPYATGHGDLVFALRRAGLLTRLRSAGVEHLFVSNVDNLAATLDPAVIGAHLANQVGMTFEVSPLQAGDKGGVPARLDGRLQVIEALRYPAGFVESSIPWFSINSFVLELAQLERDFPLDWFRVTKQVEAQPAIQFERFVNQLTAFVSSRALAIERAGADCRFLPVKDPAELRARLPLIQSVLHGRGLV